jgi:hypothetical protein
MIYSLHLIKLKQGIWELNTLNDINNLLTVTFRFYLDACFVNANLLLAAFTRAKCHFPGPSNKCIFFRATCRDTCQEDTIYLRISLPDFRIPLKSISKTTGTGANDGKRKVPVIESGLEISGQESENNI